MTVRLMAIGGALQSQSEVMRVFLQASGGLNARIAILPTASALPDAGESIRADMAALGVRHAPAILPVRQRADAQQPEMIAVLESADAIFLTGGNQARLTAFLGGTRLHQALRDAAQRGVLIAGTSAGAAALGDLMIVYGNNGNLPRQGQAQLTAGLGLISGILFDQHFRQRNRLGRLIMVVASNPAVLGIGVDEDTAAMLEGDHLHVIGSHAVTILDGAEIEGTNISEAQPRKLIAVSPIRYHILTAGCSFDLQRRCANIPFDPLEVD